MKILLCACAAILTLVCGNVSFAGQGAQRMLYTSPNSKFISTPSGDHAVMVNDTSGSIATLQASINNARVANPTNVIVITLLSNATYVVSTASLALDSRECLVVGSATIQAANPAVTVPLVQINSGATNVSIAGGTFEGSGANIQAIYAPAASRVNLDKVVARNCGLDCILLKGQGNAIYDNEMTVTRCDVSGSSAHAGISIQNSTQTVVVDNNCHSSSIGIYLSCAWADVANNTCESNSVGIQIAGGNDNVVANNTCNYNGTGITAAGSGNMIVSSSLGNNSVVGINSSGTGNNFLNNLFTSSNAINFLSSGSGNNMIAYKTNLAASGQNYFYPPLIDNQHNNPTIVNGMGRTDLTISSTTIDDVLTQYNAARATHPNNVIVLHLNGTFPVVANPLMLQSNTCVLLNGMIQIDSSTTATAAIQGGTSPKRVCISGGTIDGGNLNGNYGINIASGSMIQVDSVTIQNFGDNSSHHSGSDSIHYSGGSTPYMVTRCFINKSGARAIWSQLSAQKALYADNYCAYTRAGIDCDSSTFGAVCMFNNCISNTYGLWYEQSASHNTSIGNVCNYNDRYQFDTGNNAHTPPTEYNSYICNTGMGSVGLVTAAVGTNTFTSHNFNFNNVIVNATISGQQAGDENYYSQNYQAGGSLSTSGAESFFNSSDVSSNLFLQDVNSGLMLQALNGATVNGTPIVIDPASGLDNDKWALIPTDSGYYRITNKKSQSVMAVNGASLSVGAAIVEWTFGSSKNDQWMPMSAGNGSYYFINRLSGLCLDVPNGLAGAVLDQRIYTGAANQQFNLLLNLPSVSASPIISSIVVQGSSLFLSGSNGAAGRPFHLLGSTDIALPLNQWQPLTTNAFNLDGSFNITDSVNPNSLQQFYRLQVQ